MLINSYWIGLDWNSTDLLRADWLTLFNWVSCIADRRRQLSWVGEGVYSDATQLDVELSCVAINGPLVYDPMLNDDHLLFNIFHAVIIIIKDVNLQHKLYEENNSWNKTD